MENSKVILLVDDDEYFHEIFSLKLKSAGFKIENAVNAKEGIQKAKELKPDLILMDVRMPDMDGIDALTKMKENSETKNLKVVFITSAGDPRAEGGQVDAEAAISAGAIGFIPKSEDLNEIVKDVNKYLSK